MKQSIKIVNPKPQNFSEAWVLPNIYCWYKQEEKKDQQEEQIFYKRGMIQFVDQAKRLANLQIDNGETVKVSFAALVQANNEQIDPRGYDDMVKMNCLNEAEILHNIKKRYEKDCIFTYIGPTLIVVNPYKTLHEAFGEDKILSIEKIVKHNSALFKLSDSEPHIYSIAAMAYHSVFKNQKKQAIVISGESGAGKTENAKYAMKFLTKISQEIGSGHQQQQTTKKQINQQLQDAQQKQIQTQNSTIEEKILSCNPILEAFGNAKTIRNDNSSRFGKYVKIFVERQNQHKILGASISKYLLEKSRVTMLAKDERNYHIFYHFLKGAQQADYGIDYLKLSSQTQDYNYLNQSDSFEVKSLPDKQQFKEVKQAFKKMNFDQDEEQIVWQTLSSVLLMGNITFDDSTLNDNNPCKITQNQNNDNNLGMVCRLLGAETPSLERALTFKRRDVPGQKSIDSPLSKIECESTRDSLSKALYEKLFTWLVFKLNSSILPNGLYKVEEQGYQDKNSLSIGLLDIFGFENFKDNSFEQLCINYTNEHLQQLYISYVFKSEEQELAADGLSEYLHNLEYQDNQPIIDIFDKVTGVFALLDESCMLKNSTDLILVQKVLNMHKNSEKILPPKINIASFTIIHTQSPVEYNANGFRAKNMDELSKELSIVLLTSSKALLKDIFAIDIAEEEQQILLGQPSQLQYQSDNNDLILKKGKGKEKTSRFLGAKFRLQMKDLMLELNNSDVHFVRCIKPNNKKVADSFSEPQVLLQIRYLGVLESIEVRKASYPARKEYSQFYNSYRVISPKFNEMGTVAQLVQKQQDFRKICEQLVKEVFPQATERDILYGNTKIYLKSDFENAWDLRKFQVIRERTEKSVQQIVKLRRYIIKRRIQKRQRISVKKLAKFFKHTYIKKINLFVKIKQFGQYRRKIKSITIMQKQFTKKLKKIINQWKINDQKFKQYQLLQQQQLKEEVLQESYQESSRMMLDNSIQNIKNPSEVSLKFPLQPTISEEQKLKQLEELKTDEQVQMSKQKMNQNQQYQPLSEDSQYDTLYDTNNPENYLKSVRPQDQQKEENKYISIGPQQGFQDIIDYNSVARRFDVNEIDNLRDLDIEPPPAQQQFSENNGDEDSQKPPLIVRLLDDRKQQDLSSQYDKEASSSSDCRFDLNQDIDEDLENKIKDFNFLQFFENQIKKRSTFFGKKKIEEVMKMQDKVMKGGAYTMLTKTEDKLATKNFQLLINLSETSQKPERSLNLIKEIVDISYNTSDIFKNEVFVQINKQLNQNSNSPYITKILQMLSAYLYVYTPNPDFILATMYQLYHLYQNTQYLEEQGKQLVRYLFPRLIKALRSESNQRKILPPSYQIMALMWMKQVWIPVFFPTGSHILICVDHDETVDQLKERALKKVEVDLKRISADYFGFFEVVNVYNEVRERMLRGTEKVWELLSNWEVERQSSAKKKDVEMPIYIMMLKVRFSYKLYPKDAVSIAVFFSQTFFDIYVGKFLLKDEDLVKMAALLTITNGGEADITQLLPGYFQVNSKDHLIQQIEEAQKQYQQYTILEAKYLYLQIASQYESFMGVYVPIKYSANSNTDELIEATLVMRPLRISFLNEKKVVFKSYKITEIKRWGLSHDKYMIIMTSDDINHMVQSSMVESIGWYISKATSFFIKKIENNQQQDQQQIRNSKDNNLIKK